MYQLQLYLSIILFTGFGYSEIAITSISGVLAGLYFRSLYYLMAAPNLALSWTLLLNLVSCFTLISRINLSPQPMIGEFRQFQIFNIGPIFTSPTQNSILIQAFFSALDHANLLYKAISIYYLT